MNAQLMMSRCEYAADRSKAIADDAAASFEDAKEDAARQVTFDDVLEELTELAPEKKAHLMGALDTDRRHFAYQLEGAFTDAIEKIAKRRAWMEITKPRGR